MPVCMVMLSLFRLRQFDAAYHRKKLPTIAISQQWCCRVQSTERSARKTSTIQLDLPSAICAISGTSMIRIKSLNHWKATWWNLVAPPGFSVFFALGFLPCWRYLWVPWAVVGKYRFWIAMLLFKQNLVDYAKAKKRFTRKVGLQEAESGLLNLTAWPQTKRL